jgi:hypothetical protein
MRGLCRDRFALPRAIAIAAVILLCTARASVASWSSEFAPPGVVGEVFCAIELEGDLILGGKFSIAGHAKVQNLARWDGREFHALGEFDDEVHALALHDGKLVGAGRFRHVDGVPATIAVWDGEHWGALGGLFENRDSPVRNAVFTLFSDGSDLYAGGEFTHAGGVPASSLARWDGSRWHELAIPLPGQRPVVWAITSHDSSLVVGGEFVAQEEGIVNLAAWNGERWVGMGGGLPGPVRALRSHEGSLIAGGHFAGLDNPALRNIALWNGASWEPLGGGLYGGDETVETITVHRGEIHAGGSFTQADGGHANRVGRWDGARWFGLAAGVVGDGEVHQILTYRDALIAVGRFAQVSGNVAWSVAQWGAFWNPLMRGQAVDDRVRAFARYRDDVIAAGRFQRAGGDALAAEIARWDGTRWHDMGAKVNDEASGLAVQDDLLFAVGAFVTYAGGISRHAIVYDGTTWSDPRGGASALIRTIGNYDGRVVIGGEFLRAGGRPAVRIAQWNGQLWEGLAEGVDGAPEALLERGDTLFVGGRFLRAGNREAPYLATWNPTRRWEPFGEPLDGPILALATFEGSLIAAGTFTGTAAGQPLGKVARWSRDGWIPLGSGFDADVQVLAIHAGRLVAGGSFTRADGKPASGLAFWDGSSWNGLGEGIAGADAIVHALHSGDGELWVGGSFTQVGDTVSVHVARWDGDLPIAVWPGDTNDDGVVDARDLFPIGIFFGLEGPPRSSASLKWNAQEAPDWDDNRAARADADGNGRVDAEDVRALVENWERSRSEEEGFIPAATIPASIAAELLSALPAETNSILSAVRAVLQSYLPPRAAMLSIEAPNPFLPGSAIRWQLSPSSGSPEDAALELFDARGRRVRRLSLDGSGQEGTTRWDGRLESGRAAPGGIYFLRLRSAQGVSSPARIVLLR